MPRAYRVRFAESKYQSAVGSTDQSLAPSAGRVTPSSVNDAALPSTASYISAKRQSKSRMGCKECKIRRVKCDETLPVCLKCQRRGSVCVSTPRPVRWQTEIPWLVNAGLLSSLVGCDNNMNKRLIQYWMEKASQILCLDLENNPLSYPILKYLTASPSLVHAIQSVSAGHEESFSPLGVQSCLEERGRALEWLGHELKTQSGFQIPTLLSIFLLGVSSCWTEFQPTCYGKEHLRAARNALCQMISDKETKEDYFFKFLLGWYLFWDMACSVIAHSTEYDDSPALNEDDVLSALDTGPRNFHPINGFSSGLYFRVASLGKHCRRVLEGYQQNPVVEAEFEADLLSWRPHGDNPELVNLSIGYRNHGLILLYRICDMVEVPWSMRIPDEDDLEPSEEIDVMIRGFAIQSLKRLLGTRVGSMGVFNFQSLPLLTAASELTASDSHLREQVIDRFKALYSVYRISINLWAIDLLRELWALADCGVNMTWIELCYIKEWTLSFA